jgi:hypothetical protein
LYKRADNINKEDFCHDWALDSPGVSQGPQLMCQREKETNQIERYSTSEFPLPNNGDISNQLTSTSVLSESKTIKRFAKLKISNDVPLVLI